MASVIRNMGNMSEEKSIYIFNLKKQVTDELLYELFLQAGPIDSCTIVDQHRSQRTGHVTYKHSESVNYAQNVFKGTALYGQELVMSNCPPYPTNQEPLKGFPMTNGHDLNMLPRHRYDRREHHHNHRYDPYHRQNDFRHGDRRFEQPRHDHPRHDGRDRYSRRDDRDRRRW